MKLRKTFVLFGVLSCLFIGSASLKAMSSEDPWAMKPIEKLGRGIANVAFSPLEIPMKWFDVTAVQGGAAGLTFGTLKGVAFTIARICVGAVDIITFPFPLPGCPEDRDGIGAGYGPIMYPAWVVDADHDWENFFYDRNSMATPMN